MCVTRCDIIDLRVLGLRVIKYIELIPYKHLL